MYEERRRSGIIQVEENACERYCISKYTTPVGKGEEGDGIKLFLVAL